MEMKKKIAKINETESWLFEKNKQNWQTFRQHPQEKIEAIKINKVRNEKEKFQWTQQNTKDHKRLLLMLSHFSHVRLCATP